jgi:hypothetical protein
MFLSLRNEILLISFSVFLGTGPKQTSFIITTYSIIVNYVEEWEVSKKISSEILVIILVCKPKA